MPTTSKMGIVYPSSSDLVKDGATNMGTIATTVDNKTGLILLTTGTFSASSSQSYTSFFSSSFDTYRVIINAYGSSSGAEIRLRFRNSSGDITTSYYGAGFFTNYLAGSGTAGVRNNSSEAVLTNISSNSGHEGIIVFDLAGFSSGNAHNVQGQAVSTYDGVARFFGYYQVGTGTALTGFTIYPSTGTMTGGIKIYGYNK